MFLPNIQDTVECLVCPACNHHNLHIDSVELWNPDSNYRSQKVVYRFEGSATNAEEDNNPSHASLQMNFHDERRRYRGAEVILKLWCEGCPNFTSVAFAFHKGCVFPTTTTETTPERVAKYKKRGDV